MEYILKSAKAWFEKILSNGALSPEWIPFVSNAALTILVIIFIIICLYVSRYVLRKSVYLFIIKTPGKWDDYLIKHKLFLSLAGLVAVIILQNSIPVIYEDSGYLPLLNKLVQIYFVYVLVKIFVSVLKGTEEYLSQTDMFVEKPIASWFQLTRILIYIAAAIICLSILLGKSPIYFLGAFGAVSAVILLVFKDTILGLVASIQISSNDMIRVGDWVEMSKYNADGDVIAINLNTVKIRNWDKTISTVPTHFFITDSFKNWRGMQESGGRRIKRTIQINVNSIQFVHPEFREKLKEIHLIKDFIEQRQSEIEEYNQKHQVGSDILINGRRMTNIGVFRKYAELYLRNHPGINQNMSLMVRQLTATDTGLPIEIYCFTNTVRWVEYESIQSDIFDHLFASASHFGLGVFQSPSGTDIQQAIQYAKPDA